MNYYFYKINGQLYEYGSQTEFDLSDSFERECLMDAIAEDFYFNESGNLWDWPLKITLLDKDQNDLSVFEVEMYTQPMFSSVEEEPILIARERTFSRGETCPVCHGKGSYLEEGDAHRSTGWVPCRFQSGKFHCVNGTLETWK